MKHLSSSDDTDDQCGKTFFRRWCAWLCGWSVSEEKNDDVLTLLDGSQQAKSCGKFCTNDEFHLFLLCQWVQDLKLGWYG